MSFQELELPEKCPTIRNRQKILKAACIVKYFISLQLFIIEHVLISEKVVTLPALPLLSSGEDMSFLSFFFF